MQINGIAHVQLTVADLSRSRAFYQGLFALFEMTVLIDAPDYYYAIGGRTGLCLSPASPDHPEPYAQRRVGVHHVCFRLRSREDVDTLHAHLVATGAAVVHPPEDGPWAPGYYSVLFEDPDGIRLEATFVPGKGHLDPAPVTS